MSESSSDGNLVHVAKQATRVMTYQFIGIALGFGSNLIFARVLGAELLGIEEDDRMLIGRVMGRVRRGTNG